MPRSTPDGVRRPSGGGKISHVVIILKENHTFDNYFGTFPGANGAKLPRAPNPPPSDPNHTHAAWLTRATTAVRQQYVERDIPNYFSYARQFTLCDSYFTEVAGPSTPNHLMLMAADSPVIDNPPNRDVPSFKLKSSLPKSLERAGLTWRSYGGYAIDYMDGINANWKETSDQFQTDAASGTLANVSFVYATGQTDEHPPHGSSVTGTSPWACGGRWTR